jgi:hypothetical protein
MKKEFLQAIKKDYLLLPFFEKSLTEKFGDGEAAKKGYHHTDPMRKLTRYFRLTVIATDEHGVYFEGWSSEASNTRLNSYHGITYVNLKNLTSVIEAQMIAAHQLADKINPSDYKKGLK